MTLIREDRVRRVLWCLGMLGKPHQVRLFLSLLGRREAFTVPELAEECGLPCGVVYPFIAYLKRLGVVFLLPRPEEPREWNEIYGRVVLQRKRRELHSIGPVPLAINRGRLEELVKEKCVDSEALVVIREASG